MPGSNSIRDSIIAVQSGSAAVRLRQARRFLDQFEPCAEVLVLGASRGSVDDLARAIANERGAIFGLHRFSFTQFAARLAALELASRDRAPTTALGHEAVATRAAFEARSEEALKYFSPVSQTPGFPKALARTLLDLRLAAVDSGKLHRLARSGTDLAALLDRVESLLNEAGASDRAALFEIATVALGSPVIGWPPMPLLLLDVPFQSEIEAQFFWTLVQQSPQVMITMPSGDVSAITQLEKRGARLQIMEEAGNTDLTQLARYLFSKEPPPQRIRSGELVWFSAPGEGRECVEIARRILKKPIAAYASTRLQSSSGRGSSTSDFWSML
jgi:ATP-dependent helicase/nuclease subunit B